MNGPAAHPEGTRARTTRRSPVLIKATVIIVVVLALMPPMTLSLRDDLVGPQLSEQLFWSLFLASAAAGATYGFKLMWKYRHGWQRAHAEKNAFPAARATGAVISIFVVPHLPPVPRTLLIGAVEGLVLILFCFMLYVNWRFGLPPSLPQTTADRPASVARPGRAWRRAARAPQQQAPHD